MKISGNIVDVLGRHIFPGELIIEGGIIKKISKVDTNFTNYILPGLVDSHVHIESSMLTPAGFSGLVVPRGTVAVVSDPHEIANVLGVSGVEYMIKDAQNVPLKCFFGAPSCVPATSFETAGFKISARDIEYLFNNGTSFLAEMMNFPGVVYRDKEVWEKLELAKKYGFPIDGHAPGLTGEQLRKYAEGGISTDHECSTIEEALNKIALGIKTQIREGSAARNFEALHPLIKQEPLNTMLCTDDSHPDLIIEKGHIDRLIRLGLEKGYSIFDMYQTAVINPVQHYNLPVGLLQEGDAADLIVVDNLMDFNVLETYIDGQKVATKEGLLFNIPVSDLVNNFNCSPVSLDELRVVAPVSNPQIRLIEAEDGELLTKQLVWDISCNAGDVIEADPKQDILKIVVVNRYQQAKPVVGFIKNFGLKRGALASSVAHDSHNIVAIGCDDAAIQTAINTIIEVKGGVVATVDERIELLELPVAGLMSNRAGQDVADAYIKINDFVNEMGCSMSAPFMTLAFMPLLVIPSLKIGDKGLFDVDNFSFTGLFIDDKS